MSMNHFFGNKKRNSSILYGVDQSKVTTASSSFPRVTSQSPFGNPGDGFPPNKRYKSHTATEHKEMDDPFEDNDFTADDLEEIDIIASQALTQNASVKTRAPRSEQNAEVASLPNNTIKTLDPIKHWNSSLRTETTSVGRFGMCNQFGMRFNKGLWFSSSLLVLLMILKHLKATLWGGCTPLSRQFPQDKNNAAVKIQMRWGGLSSASASQQSIAAVGTPVENGSFLNAGCSHQAKSPPFPCF